MKLYAQPTAFCEEQKIGDFDVLEVWGGNGCAIVFLLFGVCTSSASFMRGVHVSGAMLCNLCSFLLIAFNPKTVS